MSVKENLALINQKITSACERSNRNPQEITIIAVTKYVSIERANEAKDAGIYHLGENRVEGLLEKSSELQDESIKWHFIGTLQSRKVKDVIDKVNMIHSLDRVSVAKQIQKRASNQIECFIQVNVSGESTKHGLEPSEVLPFIQRLVSYDKVKVVGLMTMAPHVQDELTIRKTFQSLKAIRDEVIAENYDYAPCRYLSMGMSNDYEIAIEEGATHIRLGSSLVGSN